jgi:DNA-binding transcriptional LysR family regulator
MDKLAEYESFSKVAASGSFTAASKSLGISASAVSKHVRSLEERLGARLLNRTTRHVALTEEGRAFFERVQGLLHDVAEAEQAVGQQSALPRGKLRVGAPMDFGRSHLAEPIARFAQAHPQLTVDVEFADRFVDLIEEGFDVMVRIGMLADSSLVARRLAPCRHVLCASPVYLREHGVPPTPQHLAGHLKIEYAYSSERSWRFETPDGPVRLNVSARHRSNNGEMIRALAVAGQGIALLPTFIVHEELRAGRLQPLLADSLVADTAIYAVYPHRKHLSAKVRVFVDFLTSHCGPRPYWDEGLFMDGRPLAE